MNEQVASAFRHLPTNTFGQGITGGGFTQLTYQNKNWTLRYQGDSYPLVRPDDGTPMAFVDVVVLEENPAVSKILYPDWGAGDNSNNAPICVSANGIAPDPGVEDPQSPACATCRHNFWVTKPTGRRGKNCQDHKRLAILLLPSMTAHLFNGTPMTEPVYLKIPPASLIPYRKFIIDEFASKGIPVPAAIVRISWAAPPIQFQMAFKRVKNLTNQEAPLILDLIKKPETKRLIGLPAPPSAPAIEAQDEIVDTGLVAALSPQTKPAPAPKPAPRPRQRDVMDVQSNVEVLPPRPNGKPKPVVAPAPEPATDISISTDFEESDEALDARLQGMITKMDDALK